MTQIQHYNDDNVIIDDACGLNSLMDNFDVQACDLWKGNVTTKREIYTEHVPLVGSPATLTAEPDRWGPLCRKGRHCSCTLPESAVNVEKPKHYTCKLFLCGRTVCSFFSPCLCVGIILLGFLGCIYIWA